MGLEERRQFAKKIMTPLESIAKHLTDHSAIEESKLDENENSKLSSVPMTRYHELNLDDKDERDEDLILANDSKAYPDNEDDSAEENATVPSNHKLNADEDYSSSTEKYETDAQKATMSTTNNCANCDNTMKIDSPEINMNKSVDRLKDIDTIEGFQRFSDSLSH